jgi:hypothetical protein
MRRGIQSWMVILVVVSLPFFWLFRPVVGLPAYFALEDCRRVALTDTNSGQAIIGVEDMVLAPGGDRLILSAMDRLAYARHPADAPKGGLYEVLLKRLAAGEVWASPLVWPGAVEGGLYPHGVAVSDDGERLAFINRTRDGKVSIIGGPLRRRGFTVRNTRSEPEFCRANNLEFIGEGAMHLRVTLDRGDCGIAWDDLKTNSTTGRVISVNLAGLAPLEVEETGLSFANGIAGLYVAETRASRLRHRLGEPVELPGGPDNINWGGLGGLIAAVHPSLFRLAAYRYGYHDTAPSRIMRIDLERNVETLFDDPAGALFSGASVAVYSDGVLVMGSMRDAGVLVCRKGVS